MGRVPPSNLDAEAAVLSAAMLDEEARDNALELLHPEHFYSNANRLIFEAIAALTAPDSQATAVDIVTVSGWLRDREKLMAVGGSRYLVQIVDGTPSVANVEDHCKIVREKYRMREIIRLAQTIAAEGYGDVGDPQEWFDQQEAALHRITQDAAREPGCHISDALTETFSQISAAAERGEEISGIDTGLTHLNNMLAGLHKGDLTIIAARPGLGKSALATTIAVNVASPKPDADGGIAKVGKGVAIFSLEMPKEQLSARMVCSEARMNAHQLLRRPAEISQTEWGRLTSASGQLARIPLWIDDTPAINLVQLRARVRRFAAKARQQRCHQCSGTGQGRIPETFCALCKGSGTEPIELAVVIVDYLQLMGAVNKGQSREQEVSEISRGLKALAKELNVAVVALSQLNRGVETRGGKDKRPMLADLRESGAIEQDADNVIFIYRDDYYNPETTDARGIAELIVAKQRNGPTGMVKVRFVAYCTRFDSLAEQDWGDE